jgi:hypothetical protein
MVAQSSTGGYRHHLPAGSRLARGTSYAGIGSKRKIIHSFNRQTLDLRQKAEILDVVESDPRLSWQAARMFPETYPGKAPVGHYLLYGGGVWPIESSSSLSRFTVIDQCGRAEDLDSFLYHAGAPGLSERYPVLSYGANRNPATLYAKFMPRQLLGDWDPARICIPVLRGSLSDADAIACRLHGQGYLYGELLVSHPLVADTTIDVHVALPDLEQLRMLHDSEGVAQGMYSVAQLPSVSIRGLNRNVAPMVYVTNARLWCSPELGSPIALKMISATGRQIPAMTSRELMEHVLNASGMRNQVSAIAGLTDDSALAQELAKYLNGQWWYQFHTNDAPIAGYSRILTMINAYLDSGSLETHSRDTLSAAGRLIGIAEAFEPASSLRLAF